MKKYLFAIALLAQTLNMQAQDWPQFLGPNRNGITTQEGLLRTWPEGGPQTLWSVNLGIGFGGPVIKAGKVYLLDRDDEVGSTMCCQAFAFYFCSLSRKCYEATWMAVSSRLG